MIRSTFNSFIRENSLVAGALAAFASRNDPGTIPAGRYDLGNGIAVSVQDYKTFANPLAEAHKKYIDIQVVISGSERIWVGPLDSGIPETEYDEKNDCRLYRYDKQLEAVDMMPGQLTVLFPEDLHSPGNCISESVPVRKLVFKIPVELW